MVRARRLRSLALALAALCGGCAPPPDDAASTAGGGATPPPVGGATPAPVEPGTADWLRFADSGRDISFRYPPDFGTRYIHALDWPPMLQVLEGPFECTEAGSETARAGRTELDGISGRRYCVTRLTEGAAGSVYTSYAYAFETDGGIAILTFSARAVQCGNYDQPQRSECDAERQAFDPGALVDAIARTVATAH